MKHRKLECLASNWKQTQIFYILQQKENNLSWKNPVVTLILHNGFFLASYCIFSVFCTYLFQIENTQKKKFNITIYR